MTKGYYTILNDRSAIIVSGEEAEAFLQSLITQDMTKVDSQNATYGALLTPQGKMDYDFFIYKQDDGYALEVENARVDALLKRIKMFVLRRKVSVNLKEIQVVVAWGDGVDGSMFQLIHDSRKNINLYRNIFDQDFVFDAKNHLTKTESKFYHQLCIHNLIPNGSADIAWGDDTAADIHLEDLNGVSFEKGCYLGQELTSRMHHRNLGKRGLYRVQGDALPRPFTDINVDGHVIGQMRSSVDGDGLAILKHDKLDALALAGMKAVN